MHRSARRPAAVLVLVLVVASACSTVARAQGFSLLELYREEIGRLAEAPGTSRSIAAGRINPAAWPMHARGGLYLSFEDPARGGDFDDLTGALSFGGLGFGVRHVDLDPYQWTDYTVGIGAGDRSRTFGIGYTWSRGDRDFLGGTERVVSGSLHRWSWGSFGGTAVYDLDAKQYLDQVDLGLRPFGPRLTFFADFLGWRGSGKVTPWADYDDTVWGYGFQAHVVPGVAIGMRADDEGTIGLRLDLAWDAVRPGVRHRVDDDGDRLSTSYVVEFTEGPSLRALFPVDERYPEIRPRGSLTYQRYRFFDDRPRLLDLLARINRLAEDPEVEGVLLDLSGVSMSVANAWEVRAQLAGLRAHGKKVLIHFDRLGISGYMLASVADELWIDPMGEIDLVGINIGRSYYARMLEKAGIGFDEWRFFRYKSAVESFARDSFSEGEREQLQAVLDSFWDTTLDLVTRARGISREEFERIVDELGNVTPREAERLGLVDAVGDFQQMRDDKRNAVARPGRDEAMAPLGPLFGDPVWRSEEWGEAPRIAVLYAIGPCAMDTGIRGRALSKRIRELRKDDSVKAIVLRVDSPGGDPLPSDLVARELREASKEKPVIVSQGQVAGSGGYWISMDGDEILASPYTITGSIGVISAHVYDAGISERFGVDYDHVQKGRGADLFAGPSLPLVGLSIPHRPATPEERQRAENVIRELYDDFVSAVAEGREMTVAEVEEIAQGRIWTGADGRGNGLVDAIGGLWPAVLLAKQKAGLDDGARIQIVEGLQPGYFPPDLFSVSVVRAWWESTRQGDAPILHETAGDDAAGFELAAGPSALDVRPDVLASVMSAEQWLALPTLTRAYLLHVLTAPSRPALLVDPIDLGAWEDLGTR